MRVCCDLTRTTVSDIVSGLIQEGLVSETGFGHSQGGKSPILLSLVDDSRWIIALDLGQKQFRGAIVNLRGKIQDVLTLSVDDRDGNDALNQVFQMLDWLVTRSNHKLYGIGVGAPGLINTNEGLVVKAVNLNWNNVPLTRLLEERYRLPVSILNDCQAAAIGEKTYTSRFQQAGNLVLIKLHNGIGSGIIINGSIYQGDGGFAGEIGHIVAVPEGGELCRCGRRGCLETVASTQALIRRAQRDIAAHPQTVLPDDPRLITIETLEEAFKTGDPYVQNLVFETAHYIGTAISSLVGLLNIQTIVLDGSMTRFGAVWLDAIRKEMAKYTLELPIRDTRIEIGELGENATILGAAAVFVNNYSYLFI